MSVRVPAALAPFIDLLLTVSGGFLLFTSDAAGWMRALGVLYILAAVWQPLGWRR